MPDTTSTNDKPNTPAFIELWDKPAVLKFFGGIRPLHTSTLYRGVVNGVYPKPLSVSGGGGGGAVRWLADECRDALTRMIVARDQPKPKPERRGRPRRKRIA
jgi:predicted DNA-binding transcriptional regulator AlpA